MRQRRRRGEDRQPGDAEREIQQLTRHPEARAERGRADEHDHRLKGERHRREWQGNADLRGHGREDRRESHGAGAFADSKGARIGARGDRRKQGRLHSSA